MAGRRSDLCCMFKTGASNVAEASTQLISASSSHFLHLPSVVLLSAAHYESKYQMLPPH